MVRHHQPSAQSEHRSPAAGRGHSGVGRFIQLVSVDLKSLFFLNLITFSTMLKQQMNVYLSWISGDIFTSLWTQRCACWPARPELDVM